jgi:hypothetical protein
VRSIIDEMDREVQDLRALVGSIAPVNSALTGHADPMVRQYLTLRRRFDNAAFVTALYACYEKFCESLVIAVAQSISGLKPYNELPEELLGKHLKKSAEILMRGRLGEGRYTGLSEMDFVKNLFNCLSGVEPYQLNAAAVVAHEANLRYEELLKIFKTAGVDGSGVLYVTDMQQWYKKEQGLEQDFDLPDGVPLAAVKERLDQLVENRNQIAHRGCSPDNLLGASEMGEVILFVEALARSLYHLAVAYYLKVRCSCSKDAFELTVVEGPYKENHVIVVSPPASLLFVGQPVICFSGEGLARWTLIKGLRVDDVVVLAVPIGAQVKSIGIEFEDSIFNNGKYFVLSEHDELVWPPQKRFNFSLASDAVLG